MAFKLYNWCSFPIFAVVVFVSKTTLRTLGKYIVVSSENVVHIAAKLFKIPPNTSKPWCALFRSWVNTLKTLLLIGKEGRKGMFYLTTHSIHFIYG